MGIAIPRVQKVVGEHHFHMGVGDACQVELLFQRVVAVDVRPQDMAVRQWIGRVGVQLNPLELDNIGIVDTIVANLAFHIGLEIIGVNQPPVGDAIVIHRLSGGQMQTVAEHEVQIFNVDVRAVVGNRCCICPFF